MGEKLKSALYLTSATFVIGVAMSAYRFLVFNPEVLLPLKTINPYLYLLLLVSTGVGFVFLVNRFPMIKGSGIPQLKGLLEETLVFKPVELPLKYGSIVWLNALGLSVGSAGPSVQIGAYIGQLFKQKNNRESWLIICGVSGLAGFLGSPMASLALAYEEFKMKRDIKTLIALIWGVGIVTGVRVILFGPAALVPLKVEMFSLNSGKHWWILAGLVCVAVVLGVLFKTSLLWIGKMSGTTIGKLLPFAVTFGLACWVPVVLGGGMKAIEAVLFTAPEASIGLLLMIVAIKYIFTLICAGSGMPAGLFFPIISLGVLIGTVTPFAFAELLGGGPVMWAGYAVVGIAVFFTTIMRRPMASAWIAIEVTGAYSIIVLCIALAYLVNGLLRKLGDRPLNDVLYEKLVDLDPKIDF